MKQAVGLLAVLTAATIALPAAAQDTDFSGTWQLDVDASEIPQMGSQGGPGGRGGRGRGFGGGPGASAALVITQTDDTLTIERAEGEGASITHYLDGRESTTAGPRGSEMTTSSRWDGGTLVTEGSMEISTPRGTVSIDTVSRNTLSDDGQTLTQTSTRSTPRGDIAMSLVYRRTAD